MVETGSLIVYTSADSVFQIAAHEDVVAPEELYEFCEIARAQLQGRVALALVEGAHHVGDDGASRPPGQQGSQLVPEHGLELPRRAWQEGEQLARSGLGKAARRRADRVLRGRRALGKPGLEQLVLAHVPALEVFLQVGKRALVQDKLQPQDLGDGLLGEVVQGGAKAARGDHEIAAGEGLDQALPEALGVVAHGGHVLEVDAKLGKLSGEEGGVGVDGVPEEQLGADGDDFSFHGGSS